MFVIPGGSFLDLGTKVFFFEGDEGVFFGPGLRFGTNELLDVEGWAGVIVAFSLTFLVGAAFLAAGGFGLVLVLPKIK